MKSKLGTPLEGFAEFTRMAAAEGAVLLKNENQMLPVQDGVAVSVFGRSQIDYYRSGTGSGGAVNVAYKTNLLDGLKNGGRITLNEELENVYRSFIIDHPFDNGGGGWAAEPWNQNEMPVSDELAAAARTFSEKALYVIGRTAGEDKDNADAEGSYRLTSQEKEVLYTLSRHFNQIAVVLNVSNIIDMSWLEDPLCKDTIKAVLYVWHGGIEGGNAAADVLTGKATPCGKLTDTIAYTMKDYPSTANYGGEFKNFYQEDIYVGYRYFETFCPSAVQFPFGFGLSYTDFTIEPLSAELSGGNISIRAKVTNTGSAFAGKEVAEVYYEAPQGLLGKPARALAAFSKTRLLKPGESQVLTLHFPAAQMASYDDAGVTGHKSCYVLEPGFYNLYIGNSVRNLKPIKLGGEKAYHQEQPAVIRELSEVMAPTECFTRMKPGSKKEDGTYSIIYEDVPQKTVSLMDRIASNLPEVLPQTGNKGITLQDVAAGNAAMKEFIAQLSSEEMAVLIRGEGMSSPKVTPGTASAFGGISDSLFAYGIPVACAADGPSGIRMDSGLLATQLPIGTLLACTWNTELMEELYIMEGRELVSNQVDSLLGPGINIHRNPMNGRNFEYYSEDPIVTGRFAAAAVSGMKKGGSSGTLKHFACNSQEQNRFQVDAVISERALREIYLKGFELAVETGDTSSIMTSYNPINGHWAPSNYDLCTTVLRGEWGYTGMVMTDWWAKMNDNTEGGPADSRNTNFMIRAQNDIYMVINNNGAEVNSGHDNTLESLENGTLTIGELQRSSMNICDFIMKAPVFSRKQERSETIRTFKALTSLPSEADRVLDLSQNARLETVDLTNYLKADRDGSYSIIVYLMSADTDLSQTACNIVINGEYAVTIQTSGTQGVWITQKLVTVGLLKGFYELTLEYIRPGMQIGWMEFSPVE